MTMKPSEFRACLERLGLSQVGAARLFGYNERTFRSYAAGDLAIPVVVALLLRVLVKFKITPEQIEKLRR